MKPIEMNDIGCAARQSDLPARCFFTKGTFAIDKKQAIFYNVAKAMIACAIKKVRNLL